MTIRLLTLASLALFTVAAPAQAGGKKKGGGSARVLQHIDRDHNGVIDGREATRAEAMYAALYALDTNHDGTLSDSELAAAKIPADTAGKGKKKKTQ